MTLNPIWPAPSPVARAATCGECVWHFVGGRGNPVSRCRRHNSQVIDAASPACPAWTSTLDCRACGACCREGFHTVEVGRRDPFVRAHGALLVEVDGRLNLPRPDGNCVCLTQGAAGYHCTTYAERPRSCREFEQGSENCLIARRRTGLTP